MKETFCYKSVSRLDMLDPHTNLVARMNKVAIIAILVLSAIGILLNYLLRMLGQPGGFYFLYSFLSAFLCVAYIYLHEFVHAVFIMLIKHERPEIRFGKLAASCGSSTIVFSRVEYLIVASAPLVVFCALLIPLCILLPPLYFPLPFAPLLYNIFGSVGDVYMIMRVLRAPKGSVVIDKGTEFVLFAPVSEEKI